MSRYKEGRKNKMKAVVLYAPGDLRYKEVAVPPIDAEDVLIRVKAAGNCGSDLHRIMIEGTYHFPCIPGHEFAGEIAKIGSEVNSWKVNDRVTAAPQIPCRKCDWCQVGEYNLCEDYDYIGSRSDGAFAEYVKIPAANLVRLPDNVDFEEGAVTDPACVALHGIRRSGGIEPGEEVAILGAGPIGMLACQWAKILGAAKVFAVDIVQDKLDIVRELGADVCINAKKQDPVKRIMKETEKGVNLVMEIAGSLATQQQSLLIAKKRGRVVHIGRSHKDVLLPDEVYSQIFRKELVIYGSVNSSFAPGNHEWETVVHFMSNGKLKIKPLISHRMTLDNTAETFQRMYKKEMVYNKIIFIP